VKKSLRSSAERWLLGRKDFMDALDKRRKKVRGSMTHFSMSMEGVSLLLKERQVVIL